MARPFIVMCAPNGARKSKDDHPAIPITPEDLADCAADIVEAGASIIHVHVRDEAGGHSLDAGRYRDATAAIRDRVGDRLVIQATTEACGIYSSSEQMAAVRALHPESVSVALREFNPDEDDEAANFYRWMAAEGMLVQHILYSPGDVHRFERLRDAGVVAESLPFVLFVLGRYTDDLIGNVAELPAYVEAVSDDVTWAVCSFGNTEHLAAEAAASSGGHIRVGFENNLRMPDGSRADDNAGLVRVAASAAGRRPIATAEDVRHLFGVKRS